jgi:hypothetical protein
MLSEAKHLCSSSPPAELKKQLQRSFAAQKQGGSG